MFRLFALALLFCSNSLVMSEVEAAEQAWGPAIGTQVDIRAEDETGRERTVADMAGEKGLLLFFNRSADW